MSFMPNPGSVVRMKSGAFAIVTNVSPKGDDDRVLILDPIAYGERKTDAWRIAEVIHEAGDGGGA